MGEKIGRPSGHGERFPCGKLKPRVSGTEIKRIMEHAVHAARDRRFGSEVGRLLLSGKITADEAATCFIIADIYGAYDRFEGKQRAARSPAYETGYGSGGPVEDKDRLRKHADAKRRFMFLDDHLAAFPIRARTVVEALCVENLSVSTGDPALLESLRGLLQFIAARLDDFEAEETERLAKERRKVKAPRKTRDERLVGDEYVTLAPDMALSGDATARRQRREKLIADMLARNGADRDQP